MENPIGIETRGYGSAGRQGYPGRNSMENPIGIETERDRGRDILAPIRRNSMENPIGIETRGAGDECPSIWPVATQWKTR